MSNTIGKLFTFTSFGESHGKGIGGIIDGCPAGILVDEQYVQSELDRRKPGQHVPLIPWATHIIQSQLQRAATG